MKKQQVYAALRGKEGSKIYNTWDECEKNTNGVSGALCKKFDTESDALTWLKENMLPGERIAMQKTVAPSLFPVEEDNCALPVIETEKSKVAIRAFKLRGYEQLFCQMVPPDTSVDVVEFLSLAGALKYCKDRGIAGKIYSRSKTAIWWVRAHNLEPDFMLTSRTEKETALMYKAIEWLRTNELWNNYEHWPDEWGDMLTYFDFK